MRKSPRQRRLEADHRGVCTLRDESSIFQFEASGEPPQKYRLIFNGNGIYRSSGGRIRNLERHECLIELGAAYPRLVPNLAWQTPIYHPNISNNGVVCLGGYGTNWVPSLTLNELCTMLWDMIRYENFDTESPYNKEAALWAKNQRPGTFPLDRRSIRDKISADGLVVDDDVEVVDSGIEIVTVAPEIVEPAETLEIVESAEQVKQRKLEADGIVFLD